MLSFVYSSVVLMRMASSYDSRNGSNLIGSVVDDHSSETGVEVPVAEKDKTSEDVEQKVTPVVV